MATEEDTKFTPAHAPHPAAIEAFTAVEHIIKQEIVKSRHDWDKHEPKMWARVHDLTDHQLTHFNIAGGSDLTLIRSGATSYGTILLGKIRIPAVNDELGEGFVHVRIHKGEVDGKDDIRFHSIFTNEGDKDELERPQSWQAVQTEATPLEFFNE
ncbi:hypothetical protein HWV62_31461 [Athelia sp. TMB]|nr:hypothetical protein HWV62_31461 [Athelia sp. TMB]